jgi:DnaJ-class molecular chaperone
MDYQDYYQTLGLSRTATPPEIKKAFRKLAREHHPDKRPGDTAAERRFKEINEAHAVLSDPEKRRKYDLLGANWESYSQAGAGGSPAGGNPVAGFGRGPGGASNVRYEFRTSGGGAGGDFSDFFRTFFAADEAGAPASAGRGRSAGPTFEEIIAQMGLNEAAGANGAAGRRHAAPPAVTEATAEISLEEAFRGTSRQLDIDGKRLEMTIPPGADNGTRVKLSGQGRGGGDVVVVVRVRPHATFTRRGADLEREVPITLEEALLGGEVPVATLKGRVLLKIPAGTQNGRVFKLTGQGMPHLRGGGVGNALVRIRVVLPSGMDADAEQAARSFFKQVHQPDPRTTDEPGRSR